MHVTEGEQVTILLIIGVVFGGWIVIPGPILGAIPFLPPMLTGLAVGQAVLAALVVNELYLELE